MRDKVFVDSNVLLYLLGNDERKKDIAKIILKARPSISAQVVSENVNVLLKKFTELTLKDISGHAKMLSLYCTINTLNVSTIEKAFEIREKYHFQWYDCTILSAAILDGCTIIYSEDMQHGQLIENTLAIVNPFL